MSSPDLPRAYAEEVLRKLASASRFPTLRKLLDG